MSKNESRFYETICDIEFKMIRIAEKCWIKVVPKTRASKESSLCIILNDKKHHWAVYDENGIESHEIYFEGVNINPSFYLKSGRNSYRIDFKKDGIEFILISNVYEKDTYLKENCNFNSPQCSCWAKAIYYTSRPDKPPFDEM